MASLSCVNTQKVTPRISAQQGRRMQMPDGIARRSQQRLIRARIEVRKTRQYGMYLSLSW
ncbi:hypothetical protein GJV11_16730 [Enterobacteriaceae bacterium RIT693]|nr:hypothetical protein [Enterobacteriaceae bacterium RIT693]